MDWLVWLLFESPRALGAVLGVALFVLLVYWRRSGRARPLLIGLGVAAALLIVQALVVTRREHADRILTRIEHDLVASKADALAAALAPDFESDGLSRGEFVAVVRRQMEHVKIRWLERVNLRVKESHAGRFVAAANYWADIAVHDFSYSPRSAWSITFVRASVGWKIADIRCLHIDGAGDLSWRDLDRQ